MAGNYQNTSSQAPRRFDKDLNKDVNDFHLPDNSWTQARNAINNSSIGDVGKLGNEPSNLFCTKAPYPIIGAIHLQADEWVIFSTDEVNSEIGKFKEGLCQYTTIVNDPCLAFDRAFLIKGVSRATSDCTFKIYWDDGKNPSRVMDINDVPWIQTCTDENGIVLPGPPGYDPVGCITCVDTTALDCDAIRLARLVTQPCFHIEKGVGGGTLPNGSYFAVVAYTISGQKITDYSVPSNLQALFDHENIAGSIDIIIDNMDPDYDEFELVLVSIINQQTVARKVGIYSTQQRRITLDIIDSRWTSVPIENIPIRTPVYERTDAMYTVNDYLIRIGPRTKFDFNYQPLANQIVAKWVAVEYQQGYYRGGGTNTGYMRDEVYSFFIRWIYDTGDKSASYHIPGRPAFAGEQAFVVTDALPEEIAGGFNYRWVVENTATLTSVATVTLPDGGVQIAEGYMGYWESTEEYPDKSPVIWNANDPSHPWTAPGVAPYPGTNPGANGDYDLCGENIRHHRFPDNYLGGTNSITNHYTGSSPNFSGNPAVRIMGVKFENVQAPLDNQGNPIPGIVGYEILRGTRQGNRTVIAKGVVSNMGKYTIESGSPRQGLYANYPYNDLNVDPFLSATQTRAVTYFLGFPIGTDNYTPVGNFAQDIYTFHSPDTNFSKPFLSGKEFKVYEELRGTAIGKFEYSEKHPKAKLISNTAFFVSVVAGIGIASIAMNGERRMHRQAPYRIGFVDTGIFGGPAGVGSSGLTFASSPILLSGNPTIAAMDTAVQVTDNIAFDLGGQIGQNLFGFGTAAYYNAIQAAYGTASLNPALQGYSVSFETVGGSYNEIPLALRVAQGIPTFVSYWSQGFDATIEIIRSLLRFRDYALKYNSVCFYDGSAPAPAPGDRRRSIIEQSYLSPQITDFGTSFRINNLYRSNTVVLQTNANIAYPLGVDNTRQLATSAVANLEETGQWNPLAPRLINPTRRGFATSSACYYIGYKQRLRNQYGQVDGIIQVPIQTCQRDLGQTSSPVLFGGDIYIGRYTEKNTFFYFYEWLYDQPDGFEFDYLAHRMLPFPRYWMNSRKFEASDALTGLTSAILNPFTPTWFDVLPNTMFALDGYDNSGLSGIFASFSFAVKYAYFYLFSSGVKDFFAETEINIDFRDWGELDSQKHYPILDEKALFDTSIIKSGNYFKYDPSLGISRTYLNYVSWGDTQGRDYDPLLSETCYQYSPNRAIYSLPAQFEGKRDNWFFFLANNYYDFLSRVTCIKPINKNGAMIFFETESPVQFLGVDQLQTDAGTKLTIGDGGLFSQPLQNILNADRPYEYGSCQDRLSVINTPVGVYWISQNQGKIFNMQQGLKEISMQNLKWWFAQYLPYQLLQQFPTFELKENPVIGIGCQSIYDNENNLVYFCKRDFIVRRDLPLGTTVTYVNRDNFLVNGILPIKLGDPNYFEDASWTASFDPKSGAWLSWHDWHPNLCLPGKNTFMTIMNDHPNPNRSNGIWIHNQRCDNYCNFYDVDYPFEVEYLVNTAQTVNSLRSIEYIMEVYHYANNCRDRFHVLDFNFDEAVIYNTEQCSGLLRLNLTPKNNAPMIVQYPQVNLTFIDILFSKEEQKYRFNQFWDITDSRGEFPIGSPYPPPTPNVGTQAERIIWNTAANGYVRNLNPANLNYSKDPLQRKKFRHYANFVLLRRRVSGDRKILVMIANNKNLYSPR